MINLRCWPSLAQITRNLNLDEETAAELERVLAQISENCDCRVVEPPLGDAATADAPTAADASARAWGACAAFIAARRQQLTAVDGRTPVLGGSIKLASVLRHSEVRATFCHPLPGRDRGRGSEVLYKTEPQPSPPLTHALVTRPPPPSPTRAI